MENRSYLKFDFEKLSLDSASISDATSRSKPPPYPFPSPYAFPSSSQALFQPITITSSGAASSSSSRRRCGSSSSSSPRTDPEDRDDAGRGQPGSGGSISTRLHWPVAPILGGVGWDHEEDALRLRDEASFAQLLSDKTKLLETRMLSMLSSTQHSNAVSNIKEQRSIFLGIEIKASPVTELRGRGEDWQESFAEDGDRGDTELEDEEEDDEEEDYLIGMEYSQCAGALFADEPHLSSLLGGSDRHPPNTASLLVMEGDRNSRGVDGEEDIFGMEM
eukprot:gene28637-34573_t